MASDVTVTILDGGLGAVGDASAPVCQMGTCSQGPLNTMTGFGTPEAVRATHGTGPLVEALCLVLARAGGPVYGVRVALRRVQRGECAGVRLRAVGKGRAHECCLRGCVPWGTSNYPAAWRTFGYARSLGARRAMHPVPVVVASRECCATSLLVRRVRGRRPARQITLCVRDITIWL